MRIDKLTWRGDTGWSEAIPVPDGRDALVLAFADTAVGEAPAAPLAELSSVWAGHAVLGCSTAGQVLDDEIVRAELVVLIARFERTRVVAHHVDVERAGGARRAGRRLATALADPALKGIVLLADGLSVNGTLLATGVADVLPDVPVGGGLAGDGDRFAHTWVLVDGVARNGWVSAVGFIGDDVELGFGSVGGWNIFGPERLVTRSHGAMLFELDGKPALELYREYLGPRADGLPATALLFPLSVRDLDGRTVVRTVLGIDEATQSLRFAGDVPQGGVAQLMRASVDSLVHGAHLAAKQAATGAEQLAIVVSCVGRRLVMGSRADEELEAAREGLAPGVEVAGFYSYGELSTSDGLCELHNQTMTITTIAERARP